MLSNIWLSRYLNEKNDDIFKAVENLLSPQLIPNQGYLLNSLNVHFLFKVGIHPSIRSIILI